MRFLIDECVSRLVADRLRRDGHDVAYTVDLTPGAADQAVLSTAQSTGRILVTEDQDFGELIVRQRLPVSGVVLLELDRLSTELEARRVSEAVTADRDKIAGHLTVIEPSRTRRRPLSTPCPTD